MMVASRSEAEEIRDRAWGTVAVAAYKIELRETVRALMFPRLESTYPPDNMIWRELPVMNRE